MNRKTMLAKLAQIIKECDNKANRMPKGSEEEDRWLWASAAVQDARELVEECSD